MSQWIKLDGATELARQFRSLEKRVHRKIGIKVVRAEMSPVLKEARALVPVASGRLKASIGLLAASGRKTGMHRAEVGCRRDFRYKSRSGAKMVTGRGKIRDRALSKGYTQDETSTNRYAGGIEFGTDRKGRIKRKAGPAMFLNRAMRKFESRIVSDIGRKFDAEIRALNSRAT